MIFIARMRKICTVRYLQTEYLHERKVRRDKVILLERGQIFNIEGHTFFTFGGAASHDIPGGALDRNDPEFEIKLKERRRDWIPYRIIGESWWPQELPTEQELQTGLDNLAKVDFTVDYVITHCCATDLQTAIVHYLNKPSKADVLTDYFQAFTLILVAPLARTGRRWARIRSPALPSA